VIPLIDKEAPELIVSDWLNNSVGSDTDIDFFTPSLLKSQRGKVIVMHAFQMLCPGCVSHGIPQTQKIFELFPYEQVFTIGLHSVFEHHQVMNIEVLKAFIHEYRLSFPIAIDQPGNQSLIPQTMSLYGMQGTPTLIIIDKFGVVRLNYFGRLNDMAVGSFIGKLINEEQAQNVNESKQQLLSEETTTKKDKKAAICTADGCSI
jgi:hypothetical protein